MSAKTVSIARAAGMMGSLKSDAADFLLAYTAGVIFFSIFIA